MDPRTAQHVDGRVDAAGGSAGTGQTIRPQLLPAPAAWEHVETRAATSHRTGHGTLPDEQERQHEARRHSHRGVGMREVMRWRC
jgi:hypothetical protein